MEFWAKKRKKSFSRFLVLLLLMQFGIPVYGKPLFGFQFFQKRNSLGLASSVALSFIALASSEKYIKNLETDIKEEDYLAMYGYYTHSDKVTVDGILRGALSIKEASTEDKLKYEKFTVESLWWNIKACKCYQHERVSFGTVKGYIIELARNGAQIDDGDINSVGYRLETEYKRIENSTKNLKSVRGQFYVSDMRARMFVSWMYIFSVLIFAFTFSYLNLNMRSLIFERINTALILLGFSSLPFLG